MGRMLGYHDSDELDRPELNKCPDCQCFFSTEECPLCGKICPEEFRAGNRAKVKTPKRKRGSSGRVQFIPWYHSWWFILLMLYFMPIVGIILFFTSPHSKKSKIIAALVVVGIYLLTIALTYGWLWGLINNGAFSVNDDITREEYVELCEDMGMEEYHRNVYDTGRYVTMELTVIEKLVEPHDGYEPGGTYYRCRSAHGGELEIYVRECSLDRKTNYLPGDVIRVYGESSGEGVVIQGATTTEMLPILRMAYSELIR